jgi:multidrug resistance protein, MATE family
MTEVQGTDVTGALERATPQRGATPGRRRRGILLLHEARYLLKVAGPIVLSQLGGVGMNTMDTIMVGPLGAEALAATGLATSLHVVLLMVTTGTILGMGPLVSQSFGAGDREACRRVLVQGVWLGLALSVPVVAVNLVGRPIAEALGQEAVVSYLVGGYMGALAWGVVPVLLFMAFRQFLEGMGLTRPAMVITFLGLAVNFVGNRVLIYGVEGWVEPMGVVGSGWSTTLVRWAMLIAMGIYLYRHPDLHPFRGVNWAPARALVRRIFSIGAPTGAQVGLEVGLFSFAAVMMGWFGALELGTHQVAINIAATTFMVALGVSLAGSIRVGQHIGAGNHPGVRRATLLTYLLSLVFMGACALLFLVVPEFLLGLYSRDPEIIALGKRLLLMAALFQLFDGAQVAGFCVLRGAADTRIPMLLAALSYWVIGVPAAYILGFVVGLGPVGVWGGLCVGLAAASLMLLHRVRTILLLPAARRGMAG